MILGHGSDAKWRYSIEFLKLAEKVVANCRVASFAFADSNRGRQVPAYRNGIVTYAPLRGEFEIPGSRHESRVQEQLVVKRSCEETATLRKANVSVERRSAAESRVKCDRAE